MIPVEYTAACLQLDSQERQSECSSVSPSYQCGLSLFSLARETMTEPNSTVTLALINFHRQSSMAPFFDCEKPASKCMNGKMRHKQIYKHLQFRNTTKLSREFSLFRQKLGTYSSRETVEKCMNVNFSFELCCTGRTTSIKLS